MTSNQWDKKQFENGRSMTEMLGVLAIIAILTLSGGGVFLRYFQESSEPDF